MAKKKKDPAPKLRSICGRDIEMRKMRCAPLIITLFALITVVVLKCGFGSPLDGRAKKANQRLAYFLRLRFSSQ
jgi:hypothetical protein